MYISLLLNFNECINVFSSVLVLSGFNQILNELLINNATDTVKLLEGVGFSWKDNGNKSYGVIAQELEQVIPELVTTNIINGEDIKSVNYDGLVAFLINTVKEMDARINELENK